MPAAPQAQTPRLAATLRAMVWSARRDRQRRGHLLRVLKRFIGAWAALRWRRARLDRPLVAIAMLEHIGDIVASEPVARAVRAQYPDAHLVWVTRHPYREIPRAFADVDEVFSVGCLTEWMLLKGSGLFDAAFDLHVNGRMCLTCCIPVARPDGAGFSLSDYYHHGNLLDIACANAGLPALAQGPALVPSLGGRNAASLGLAPDFVVVHRASNEAERDWTQEKWDELIAHITSRLRLDVLEIGPSPSIFAAGSGHRRRLPAMPLMDSAALIRSAKLFIGIDSGPAHIANAVGTRGIILLGRYRNFDRYMPYSGGYQDGSNATLLYADGPASDLELGRVIAAVESWREAAGGGLAKESV